MLIQVPFSGFYNSIHSDNIDLEIEFTDYETGCTSNERLNELAWESMNWHNAHIDYAKEYAAEFARKFDLKLEFKELNSPREYNFATDRIFCEISLQQAQKMLDETDGLTLKKHAKAMFTSRDGFISFYEPDFYLWGPLHTWDLNQLHCLLMAWLESKHDVTNWHDEELYLMDDVTGNGFMSELVYNNCANKRLFVIHDYLQTREARKAA